MGEPGQVERGRIAMGQSREARNAIHLEAIAHALQAHVRLKVAQIELQQRALELDMPREWHDEIMNASIHGTNIDLPLDADQGPSYQESREVEAGATIPRDVMERG